MRVGQSGLFCRGPLAADGGDDGAFFFELCKGFVHFFAVCVEDFGDIAGRYGLSGFLHGFEYLFFHDKSV